MNQYIVYLMNRHSVTDNSERVVEAERFRHRNYFYQFFVKKELVAQFRANEVLGVKKLKERDHE